MLSRLLQRWLSPCAPKSRPSRQGKSRSPRRLMLELLEDRVVPVAFVWDHGGDGINWTDPNNWNPNGTPGVNDDVTINRPLTDVVFNAGTVTINSLTLNTGTSPNPNSLTLQSGSLTVAGALTLGSASGSVFTLNLSGATLNTPGTFAAELATFNYNSGSLTFTPSGTPTLTNVNLSMGPSATGPVTFVTRGLVNFTGTVKTGQTVVVRGIQNQFNSVLNTSGAGTNAGTIRLEAVGLANATLAAAAGTNFTNLSNGTIEAAAGSGSRFLTGHIINQGQLTAAAGTQFTATTGLFESAGGMIQGRMEVEDSQLRVSAPPPVETTIFVQANSTLLGNNPIRSTLVVRGVGNLFHSQLNVQATFSNAGTIRLDSIGVANATLASPVTGAFTNLAGGAIVTAATGGGSRLVTGNLINQGLITATAVNLEIRAGVFDAAGGTVQGTAAVTDSQFRVTTSPPVDTTITIHGTSTLLGDNLQRTTLLVQGVGNLFHSQLNVQATFSNAGTIRLDSIGVANATLAAPTSGTFINASGGAIVTAATGGGSRLVTGNLTHQGLITATAVVLSMSAGLFDAAGGTVQGTAAVLDSQLRVTASPPVDTTITIHGVSTLQGNNLTRTTLLVQGVNNAFNSQLTVAAGFSNAGTVRLDSIGFAGATLFAPDAGTMTNPVGSTITVEDGGPRTISARLVNSGSVIVDTPVTLGRLGLQHINAGTFRINNNAQVTLLGATLPQIGLTNMPDGQILGVGTLEISESNFRNRGLIFADITGTTFAIRSPSNPNLFLNFNAATSTLTEGTYKAAGTILFDGAVIARNEANIELTSSGANIVNQGGVSALNALAVNAAGASFTLTNRNFTRTGNFQNDGTMTVGIGSLTSVTGTFTNGNAGILTVDRSTMSINTALTNLMAGGRLVGGTFRILGDPAPALAGRLRFPGAPTITNNAAQIILINPNSFITDLSDNQALGNLTVNETNGHFTIQNGRNISTTGNFTNDGVLTVGTGSEFAVGGTLTNLSGTTLMGGTFIIAGILRVPNADIQTNASNVTLDGPTSRIITQTSADSLANLGTNAATGILTIRNGRELTVPAGLTNNGRLNADGTIVGNLTNAGQLHPGTSPGRVTVNGNHTQTAAGSLNIEIGGLTAGSQFDQLAVNGNVTLDGILNVSLLDGFVPVAGNAFPILTFLSRTGTTDFATRNGLILGNGLILTSTFDPASLTLTANAVGIFQFSAASSSVGENVGMATVTVTRIGGAFSTVTVAFATSNGSALAGTDYTATSGTLTFTPGQTTATFAVAITDDAQAESSETINLTLSNPTGGAGIGAPSTAVLTIIDNDPGNLTVTAFNATSTGFTVQFSQPLATGDLNLYDGASLGPALGAADVTVMGGSGPVRGSLVVDSSGSRITFLRTGGTLSADTYTVILRSAADGFHTPGGALLDGNADGTAGDNFVTTFAVTSFSGVVVGVPDFTRGPTQAVNIPADSTNGIPVMLSSTTGVTSIDLTLRYNPALLSITNVTLPLALQQGGILDFNNNSTTGVLVIGFSYASLTPLPAGPLQLAIIEANVPAGAVSRYTEKHILDITNILINDGAIAAREDDGLHVVGYFGDTNASGASVYSALDANRALRVAVSLDSGFSAYQLADPVVIADITGNGLVGSADATAILRAAVGLPEPRIPAAGPTIGALSGPDPFLNLPKHFQGRHGDTITVPVLLDLSDGLEAADLAISYDPTRLQIVSESDIQRGNLTRDFNVFAVNLDDRAGTLRIGLARSAGPIVSRGSGSVVEITFRIREDAATGPVVLNLRQGIGSTLTQLNEGGLDLIPDPSNEEGDVLDGQILILDEQGTDTGPVDPLVIALLQKLDGVAIESTVPEGDDAFFRLLGRQGLLDKDPGLVSQVNSVHPMAKDGITTPTSERVPSWLSLEELFREVNGFGGPTR